MKALVAFQIVPDLEPLQGNAARVTENGEIDTSFLAKALDCYDASALELAIQLSEKSESCHCLFELEAVTADNHPVESVMKSLYALGFGRVVHAFRADGAPLSGDEIASAVCAAAVGGGADLLLFGRESSTGGSGILPYIVAETLKIPVYPEVARIDREGENLLKICCLTDDGSAEFTVRTPAVLTVGNAENAFLRFPTLKDKLKSKNKEVLQAAIAANTGTKESAPSGGVRKTGIRVISRKREGRTVRLDVERAACFLMEEYLEKHDD